MASLHFYQEVDGPLGHACKESSFYQGSSLNAEPLSQHLFLVPFLFLDIGSNEVTSLISDSQAGVTECPEAIDHVQRRFWMC